MRATLTQVQSPDLAKVSERELQARILRQFLLDNVHGGSNFSGHEEDSEGFVGLNSFLT